MANKNLSDKLPHTFTNPIYKNLIFGFIRQLRLHVLLSLNMYIVIPTVSLL